MPGAGVAHAFFLSRYALNRKHGPDGDAKGWELYNDRARAALEAERAEHSRTIRTLHEQIFYRPILAAAARLSTDEVRLSEAEAKTRLEAFGYRDPAGAMRISAP